MGTSSRGSTCRRPSDMRAPGAATGVYALECAMDELAVALKLDPLELRLRCYSDRDQNDGHSLHQQEAARMLPPGRGSVRLGTSAIREPRSMRDGRSWSAGAWRRGVWEALQMPTAARIVLTANGHAEVACATSDIGTGTYTIMAQVAADDARAAAREYHGQARRFDAAAVAGRGRIVDGGVGRACDRQDRRRRAQGAAARWPRRCRIRRLAARKPDDVTLRDGKLVDAQGRRPRGVDRGRDAAWRRRPHRARKHQRVQGRRVNTPATRIRRSSPR